MFSPTELQRHARYITSKSYGYCLAKHALLQHANPTAVSIVMVLQSLTSRAVESAQASTASPAVAGAGAQGMYQDYR